MSLRRTLPAFVMALGLVAPHGAFALSLTEAITIAQRTNPGLAQTKAQAEAAEARLAQAHSGRLPALTLSGQAGRGTTDLGGFFGFGRADVSPRAGALELRQPLYTGGATTAAIDRARQSRDAALIQVSGAKALLAVQVAEAYAGVLSTRNILALHEAQVRQIGEIAAQAELRFKGGETPRTDLAQAQARLAEARAGLARARGDTSRARAHFISVVGMEADDLEPLTAPPGHPASLDEATTIALQASPALAAAEALARAAEASVRYAQAERLPNLALTATASSARDQFFPGYRADGVTVGVQGRWTLFAGGLINGKVGEARADVRSAQAGVDQARAMVRETVVSAWEDVQTSRALVEAAVDQVAATASALDSVRNEVRVGQKPTLDLLDAERDVVAAESVRIAAQGEAVIAAYRLNAMLRGD